MNWGMKIIIALALFMAMIVSFGVYMVSSNSDTLVAEDYYERGLNYDQLRKDDSVDRSNDTLKVSPSQ